ncbi:MAG: hypothetical protein MJE66_15310 [Proteobacteria bacterium]|nr:hypothetical protein [Pseudomonadota bacterium]
MRRLRYTALALLVFVGCEEEGPPKFTDEVYCDIIASMDEEYCPGWREDYDRDYAAGCYEAAISVFEDEVGATYPDYHGISPSSDTCSE